MINFNNLKVGTQIIFSDPIKNKQIVAVCISKNDKGADFLTEHGGLYLKEEDLEQTVISFKIQLIDESHEKWQTIDSKIFTFFSKLNDLEDKYNNGDINDNQTEFLHLLEQLGDEFDKQV